jgi:hypothetical protein
MLGLGLTGCIVITSQISMARGDKRNGNLIIALGHRLLSPLPLLLV